MLSTNDYQLSLLPDVNLREITLNIFMKQRERNCLAANE